MKRTWLQLMCICLGLVLSQCGGSESNSGSLNDILKILNTSVSGSEDLDDLIVNTFTTNGVEINVDPEKLDFVANYGEFEIGDKEDIEFTITNNSGATRTIAFEMYAVTQGFTLLDQYGNNVGVWDNISIEDGSSKTFAIRFEARSYGTNLSYLVITADVNGEIHLPFRAKVSGGGEAFRAISAAYSCSDDDAPDISLVDFYKVSTGNSSEYAIKLCNIGGDDIQIYSAKITNGNTEKNSEYFTNSSFSGRDIFTSAEIDSDYGLGFEPETSGSFATPEIVDSGESIDSPSSYYSVVEDISQTLTENITIEAGDYTKFDVTFSPNLKIEAPEGKKYNALPANAVLTFETSLGPIGIDLYGATSGYEPELGLAYRFSGEETWTKIDTSSNVAAIDFGDIDVFLDSIPNNGKIVELQVSNLGTSSYPLEFYPTSLVGYFEYYVDDGENLSFPLTISSGESDEFKIRYLPTPSEKEEETHWDVGQLKFSHTGALGPDGQISFVADQSFGYAVTVKLSGSELKHSYDGNEAKKICSVQIDGYGNAPTEKTFTIANNDPQNTLEVNWSFIDPEGVLTATSETPENFSVEPGNTYALTLLLSANSSASEGETLSGNLNITTSLVTPDGKTLEEAYPSDMADKESNDFVIKLQGTASSSGTCDLTPDLFADEDGDGIVNWYMIRNRTGMAMAPDLPESNRDLPPNYSLLPFEVDLNKMTIRFSKRVEMPQEITPENEHNLFRAYSHFFTNSKGCPTTPTLPYAETTRGGWMEPGGLTCDKVTSSDGEFSVYMDQLTLKDPGPEDYTDSDNITWRTYKHRFAKVDPETCKMEYYGEFTTLAYQPDKQTLEEFYEECYEQPFEDEAYYENCFGAWKHNSKIVIDTNDFQCGSKTYNTGDIITDPDEIKECYLYLATLDDSYRMNGRFDQESYFSFEIEEGDKDCDPWNDPENCHGAGTIAPHLVNGEPVEGFYDITLYNAEVNAYVVSGGDRTSFMRHESHMLYSKFYLTFTTHALSNEADIDGDYKALIANETRPDIDKNQIFLKDGEKYDIGLYFTNDGINSNMSNVIDPDSIPEAGIDYGGYGKGAFRNCDNPANCDIIPAGWPLNTQENNLIELNGVAVFTLEGNIMPGFASASGGKGKAIYFSMQGCMLPQEDMTEGRGCYPYKLDDTKMPDGETLVIDEYAARGMLPDGYPDDPAECANFIEKGYNDPYLDDGSANPNYEPFKYLACINYTIEKTDRDHYTNYYDKTDPFYYENNFYGPSYCGYGM